MVVVQGRFEPFLLGEVFVRFRFLPPLVDPCLMKKAFFIYCLVFAADDDSNVFGHLQLGPECTAATIPAL